MGDVEYTHRFVATADTGREMARAFVGHLHRTRRLWTCYAVALAFFALAMSLSIDDRFGVATRVVWGVIYALIPTLVMAGLVAVLSYVRTLRASRVRLFEGAVVESGFTDDELFIRNPIESVRMSYRSIKSVTPRGEFVFMQRVGLPVVSIWPRELFPDEAVDRVRR